MSDRKSGVLMLVGLMPALVLGGLLSIVVLGGSDEAPEGLCESGGGMSLSIDPDTVPETTVADYGRAQLVNAAHIIQAGKDLGLGVRDQTIGVMTAMGESSLRVLDYGDAVGPDSRGLFQQRGNGAWGSYEDRMDPYISATNFFRAMMKIEATVRNSLEPTAVAHRTQRNADPYHYTRFWDPAVAVVEALSGLDTGLNASNGNQVCSSNSTTSGEVNANGWARPVSGATTSPYGWRIHPITRTQRFHYGVDLSASCGAPIWAANDGVVVARGFDSGGNGYLTIDHGGVQTKYLHMYDSGMFVNVGEEVKSGEQIAEAGSSGQSTGCHLHFKVLVNGEDVDPGKFMSGVGVTLG